MKRLRLLAFITAGAAFVLAMLLLQNSAGSGEMTLLTVAEDLERGATAQVHLEIRPGTGRIFLDSFPLTRIDTQGSTRYANQIACDLLQEDCSRYDFLYTIRADSAIIGGPSASAAIAVLTAAVLDGQEINDDISMTGTINSGGIIGPVGGVEQKIQGASRAGIKNVLIPSLSILNLSNVTNTGGNVTVHRVGTLEEALRHFTGKDYSRDFPPVGEPEHYDEIMSLVADDICSRTQALQQEIRERNLNYNDSQNYSERIEELPSDRDYSRASLCFSSNIGLNSVLIDNMTGGERQALHDELWETAYILNKEVGNTTFESIIDLEVYAIVMERLLEAQERLDDANITQNSGLAYVEERLISAQSWRRFFEMEGKDIQLDEDHLRRVCLSKLEEAEERVSNLRVYSESLVVTSAGTLTEARRVEDPILCIFIASKAKAQANLVLNALVISEENVPSLVDEKIAAVGRVLGQQQAEGFFPLLGYSYWKYSQDLASEQPYSALTFAEYALELSNLDMYFAEERNGFDQRLNPGLLLFFFGAVFGISVVLLLGMRKKR